MHEAADALRLLGRVADELGLGARAHDRILKVARTVADLDGREDVGLDDLSEAIGYQVLDRPTWARPAATNAKLTPDRLTLTPRILQVRHAPPIATGVRRLAWGLWLRSCASWLPRISWSPSPSRSGSHELR